MTHRSWIPVPSHHRLALAAALLATGATRSAARCS